MEGKKTPNTKKVAPITTEGFLSAFGKVTIRLASSSTTRTASQPNLPTFNQTNYMWMEAPVVAQVPSIVMLSAPADVATTSSTNSPNFSRVNIHAD